MTPVLWYGIPYHGINKGESALGDVFQRNDYMFIDWLSMYQDYDFKLPFISETVDLQIDTATGETQAIKQPIYRESGSYCTSISIKVNGSRIRIEGNPSRFGRVDNLFGFETIEECVKVYNLLLLNKGLPPFTKCTKVFREQNPENEKVLTTSDGAIITELHLTENKKVGFQCEEDYLKALSTQRCRNSVPHLFENGKSVDWKTKKGNAGMIYASVYEKANELELHHFTKIKNKYGKHSPEFEYLQKIRDYCRENGVVRFEQKLKSAYIRKNGLRFYGLTNYEKLRKIHSEFINIDRKIQVNAMKLEMINDRLLRKGICDSQKAANTTAFYAMEWKNGKRFDLKKSSVKVHRARLRKLGIDIAEVCDLTKFTPVYVTSTQEVIVEDLPVPEWYKLPRSNHLRLVA